MFIPYLKTPFSRTNGYILTLTIFQWGLDHISPLPKGKGSVSIAIFGIDYFTK